MVKKILKILYISFGLLIAILVYMMGYQSNLSSHVLNMTSEAIESGDYSEIALIHGGCFDRESVVTDDSDQLEIGIYPAAHLAALSYYEAEDSETKVTKRFYENAYNIYVIAPKFSVSGYSENGKKINNSGVNFVNGDKSYKLNFAVTDEVNTDKAVEKPLSAKDAYFSKHNYISDHSIWGFMNIVVTQGMLEAMGINTASKIELVNDVNEVVASFDVKLDFSQKFFTDVNPLVEKYNEYIKTVEANPNDKDTQEAANTEFNKFYEGENGFHNSFLKLDDSYSYRHADKVLQPGKLVWQTIGMVVLYVVVAVALYLLFFHFNDLKGLFTRNKGNYRVNPASVNAAKANAINAQAKIVEDKKPQNTEKPAQEAPAVKEAAVADEASVVEETLEADEVAVADEAKEEIAE